MNKGLGKTLTILASVAIALFILSLAIACPIYIRQFYYAQIQALNLPETTGYSEETMREAYDEMMDYCLGQTEEFGTGQLAWSEEGKSHFQDCRGLFKLDSMVVLWSLIVLLFLSAMSRLYRTKPERIAGRGPLFWGPVILLVAAIITTLLAARDFYKFFVVFHHTFFPGKDNWIFDPAEDEIIKILPEEFFRNCAILIVTVAIVLCIVCMILDIAKGRRNPSAEK